MADEELERELTEGMGEVMQTAKDLEQRLQSGEEIDEKELKVLARMLAVQMEHVRSRLEEAMGPIDPEELRAQMEAQLSPEEFAEWSAHEEERKEFRDEFQREQAIRNQLGG
jgi:hypothetical protein